MHKLVSISWQRLLLCSLLWITPSLHAQVLFGDGFENNVAGPFNDIDAARFLDQATFGPRPQDIARLRQLGYTAWLEEQFNAAISLETPHLDWIRTRPSGQNGVYRQARLEAWLTHAAQLADPSSPLLTHNDQLRQRVAFALSELMVVSDSNAALLFQQWGLANYNDLLAQNAFGNYRTLLEAVTKHPAMGTFLNMLGNRKPNATLNIRPDENYAREVLQLFSIGLNQLNLDGTEVLVGGQPVPTYNQNVVRGFAHVFTGWNWPGCSVADYDDCAPGNPYDPEWVQPMQAVEGLHDTTTNKQLLNYAGVALPVGLLVSGGNAQQEMTAALDNVFFHPNVGPFVAHHLIQRLVTSNPTPAYVQRVATVFNNNGSGVRGDLKAVVKAVLMDAEARFGQQSTPATFGKMREPLFKLVQVWRLTTPRSVNGRINLIAAPHEQYGQSPLSAPSVFNFFKPDYAQPGEIRNAGLVSPEFQIATDTLLVSGPNDYGWRIFYFYVGSPYSYAQDPDQMLMDYAELRGLAANPAQLVERINLALLAGRMSEFMKQVLVTRLNALPMTDAGLLRVQHALYLTLISPEYSIQK
ncbi:MAG: DUF1800 family protein [Pseudomonadota bacterium]|nr:DUF1800 family protein [Pseudomonadota bacterium]